METWGVHGVGGGWAGPPRPLGKRRPLIARVRWMVVGTPRNCGDDTIATAGGNRSRVLSLMSALRVNSGTVESTSHFDVWSKERARCPFHLWLALPHAKTTCADWYA